MSLAELRIPEAIGFGVLGATIGAEVCSLLGGDMAHHVGLGLIIGAMLFMLASQIPMLSRRRGRTQARAVKPDTGRPVTR